MGYIKVGVKLSNFRALITITANPYATITVTGSKIYTAVANGDGIALVNVKKRGTYTITTSELSSITDTVTITENHAAYTADVYVVPSGSEILTASGTFVVPNYVHQLSVFLVGGGGGGGGHASSGTIEHLSGGGGGGGYVSNNYNISVIPESEIPYTIGAGGAGSLTGTGGTGGATTFGSYTVNGGLGGTNYYGGAGSNTGGKGGLYHGGTQSSAYNISPYEGAGNNENNKPFGDVSATAYAGAGGGGGVARVFSYWERDGAAGGVYGGGTGGSGRSGAQATSGVANTGGGGGGCGWYGNDSAYTKIGGDGGSGLVIVRWNKGGH